MIVLKNNVNRKNDIRMIQMANSSNSYAGLLKILSPNLRGKNSWKSSLLQNTKCLEAIKHIHQKLRAITWAIGFPISINKICLQYSQRPCSLHRRQNIRMIYITSSTKNSSVRMCKNSIF